MNPTRKELVKKAFNKMDGMGNSNGVLEVDDIRQSYNASNHPDANRERRPRMRFYKSSLKLSKPTDK